MARSNGAAFDGAPLPPYRTWAQHDADTYSDYTLSASKTVIQEAPLAANLGWMGVDAGKSYALSAYMRADRDGFPPSSCFVSVVRSLQARESTPFPGGGLLAGLDPLLLLGGRVPARCLCGRGSES